MLRQRPTGTRFTCGTEVKSEETALLNYKEDFATTGKELDSVLAYLDKLKPQCETKVLQNLSCKLYQSIVCIASYAGGILFLLCLQISSEVRNIPFAHSDSLWI